MIVERNAAHDATNLFCRGHYTLLESIVEGVLAHGELQELMEILKLRRERGVIARIGPDGIPVGAEYSPSVGNPAQPYGGAYFLLLPHAGKQAFRMGTIKNPTHF